MRKEKQYSIELQKAIKIVKAYGFEVVAKADYPKKIEDRTKPTLEDFGLGE